MKKSYFYLILVILVLLSVGYFKPGIDVLRYYSYGSQSYFNKLLAVGSYFSTLIINGKYIGVEICTLIMTSAIYSFFTSYSTSRVSTKVLFISATIMSWPCYPLITNTLRQGLGISFLLLLLSIWSKNTKPYKALKVLLIVLSLLTHAYSYLLILSLMVSLFVRQKKLERYSFLLILICSTLISFITRYFSESTWLNVDNSPTVTIILLILNIIFFGYLRVFDKQFCLGNDLGITINMCIMLSMIGVYFSFFGIFALSERIMMFPTIIGLIFSMLYVLNCKTHPRKELIGTIYIGMVGLSGVTYFLMN